MEKTAIGTNDLGMHIVIRPISKDLLSKDEIVGMETGKINSLLTARRPITFVDAISALPPLLPSSADPITGRRLYSVNEIMSGSCSIHFGPPVPELLRYETELSANTVLESSILQHEVQPSESHAMVNGSRTYSVTRIQILLWSRWRPLQIGAWRVLSSSW